MVEVPVADRRDFAMVAFVFVRLRVLDGTSEYLGAPLS
jgi:hypothetical protein